MGYPIKIIKKKDGTAVFHCGAGVDADSVPPSVDPSDIEDSAFYADSDEIQGELNSFDGDEQVEIQNGRFVINKSKKGRREKIKEREDAVDLLLDGIEDDTALDTSVRPYLIAIRDLLQRGKSKIN